MSYHSERHAEQIVNPVACADRLAQAEAVIEAQAANLAKLRAAVAEVLDSLPPSDTAFLSPRGIFRIHATLSLALEGTDFDPDEPSPGHVAAVYATLRAEADAERDTDE